MKLLVFSDPHLVEPDQRIIGLNPSQRFSQALDHALKNHPDAAHMVILGDLTHHGRDAQYLALQRCLDAVNIPLSLMLGNHDDRSAFLKAFPDTPLTPSGHVQHVVQLGHHRLICLDTLDAEATPKHSGLLCEARMGWLRDALEAAKGAPVTLALHHPPFVTGLDGMDAIRLRNAQELQALIAEFPNVVQLLCGHVHRNISGGLCGTSFATFKSTCHQSPLTLGLQGSDHSIDEPAGYGIVLFTKDRVIVHTDDLGGRGAPTVDGHSA
ncbi:phosphodiesterase [uncultured Litoreibacter sp.]|uniref:phosphodiesterase n=1 Tax=uncultured Litoreibacter sp. TaxID=1392394 RepID=UPI0026232A32|nr:phosphodiesterase [uncultured Litoreibacter sp.]